MTSWVLHGCVNVWVLWRQQRLLTPPSLSTLEGSFTVSSHQAVNTRRAELTLWLKFIYRVPASAEFLCDRSFTCMAVPVECDLLSPLLRDFLMAICVNVMYLELSVVSVTLCSCTHASWTGVCVRV